MQEQKKIIVSVTNDLYTDQRVRKICEFLTENNYNVLLVGRKLSDSKKLEGLAYRTKRFRLLFNNGPLFYAFYNLRLFFFLIFQKADILISNDLDTLYANHWAKKFKSKTKLFYDSHEYYCHTPELVSRPRVQRFWHRIEKRCVPKVDVMYTVNQSIADIYAEEYNREVLVVRNITDRTKPQLRQSKSELGLPEDKKIVIMQGAGINIDRGAEEMIEAIQSVDNAVLAIVGDGDVVPQLKETVAKNNWQDKVLFFGKRPYDELLNFTLLSDVGVSMDKDSNPNYRYALGNKVFDYINCKIPLLVSDLPEVGGLIRKYEIGVICSSHEPAEISAQLNALFSDESLYAKLKENTKIAATELTWENEKKSLEKIYLGSKVTEE